MTVVPFPSARKGETAGKGWELVETSKASSLLSSERTGLYQHQEVRLSGSRNEVHELSGVTNLL